MATLARAERRPRGFSRRLYFASGLLFVSLGMVGAFVPLLPTTIFLILALWCFKRSSRPLEEWLLNHRIFGPALRDWDKTRSLTRRTKVAAIVSIWTCMAITIALTRSVSVAAPLVAVGAALSAYIATRATKATAEGHNA